MDRERDGQEEGHEEARDGWVFTGESAKQIISEAAEIAAGGIPDDARVRVRKKPNGQITVQFIASGYTGPETNDSAQCPGRPGC